MHTCLIEPQPGTHAEATAAEARLLLGEGHQITMVMTDRTQKALDALPDGCRRVVVVEPKGIFRRGRLMLKLYRAVLSVRADFYHAHSSLRVMMLARIAAWLRSGRYFGDFNNIMLLARGRPTPADGPAPTTFDHAEHWQREMNENEKNRLEATLDIVPEDARSAADIGCGDGRITNRLAEKIPEVLGIDQAEAALEFLQPPVRAISGTSEKLPLEDQCVDLVIITEVIEHLPGEVLTRTLNELQRVARKYIIIGVPFEEQLATKDIICPHDHTRFNVNGHLHRFDRKRLGGLLKGFTLVRLIECGAPRRFYYHPLLRVIKQRLGGTWARLPYSICPTCSANLCPTDQRERNAISRWCDRKNAKSRERRNLGRSHVVALYERINP